jgi:hypothetical protein
MSEAKLKEERKEGKTSIIKIDDGAERKLSEDEFFEKIFMAEWSKFPEAIQEALIRKQVEDMQHKDAKDEIEALLKSGTLDRKEKMRLKLKKKVLDKNIQ